VSTGLDMFLFKKNKEVVGIDIGSSSVKIVQLKDNKGSYQLLNAGVFPLPPEAIVDNTLMDSSAVATVVQKLVQNLGIKIKDVVCSISGNSVIIRKIVLPAMPQDELEDQISWEAEQYIPFDINDVNMDFQILSPDSLDPSKMNVLLVASKKDIISDYVALFNEAGMQLAVVDVDSFAVQNAFEVNYDYDSNEIVALINIGASIMNINVIKDGVTLFTRDVQMGGNLYTEEIQKQMGLSSKDAETGKLLVDETSEKPLQNVVLKLNETIAQEIRRSLDFYNSTSSEERISRVIISGGCSKVYHLVNTISELSGLPVERLNPFAKLKYNTNDFDPEYLEEIGPFMAVPVGLAIRRVGDR